MDPILAWVRRLWDAWDIRILVLLSLFLQIFLTLFGNRRKYIPSLWISIVVWSAYLMADWVATVDLSKLSDAQVNYENGNALRAIWAPLLLLHLGGPDAITAYSLEDNHLWLRHLFGLVVQFSVAVYVLLMSWKHSWFSIMSIPALVAGLIKYGERTWVLMSVSHDKSGDIVPFDDLGGGPGGVNCGNSNTSDDENSIRVLRIAYKFLKEFKSYIERYDVNHIAFNVTTIPLEIGDIKLFWNVIEVEMGLMFDLLYTKAAINFRKGGWIYRCITFTCTITVLIALIFQLTSTRKEQEKWHKVDIAITAVLLVGAQALEIYAIISLYLSSDWVMLWLIKHNRGKQIIQLRKTIPWLFLPKQYRCETMGQFDLLHSCIIEPDQKLIKRTLRSLLGVDHFKHMLDKFYSHKTAVIVPSDLLLNPIFECCRDLRQGENILHYQGDLNHIEDLPLELQIVCFHFATEACYNLEMEWDNLVSQDTMPQASGSSLSWEENKKLCRTLSHYMMYLLVMRSSLLPVSLQGYPVSYFISKFKPNIRGARDVRAACQHLWDPNMIRSIHDYIVYKGENRLYGSVTHGLWSNEFYIAVILGHLKSKQKDERWEMLKSMWVRILCYAASRGPRNEHLRQLSMGGEFITFLWFFIPQSHTILTLRSRVNQPSEDDFFSFS